ncbi:MAG: AgmX/PglI C-terminal domain-containing protein [Polyangiaceae bacterium]|nr:AgmX/PglI C-terminal domain-containing protein [Polyangiaceae bacterium]
MRPSVLLAVFFGVAASSAGFVAACASGSTQQEANGSASDSTSSPTGTEAATSNVDVAPPPSTAPDTGEPRSDITNEPPDGGVVMNNATTSGDAGSSDRLGPIKDLVVKNRDKYRACFDAWLKKNPGQKTEVKISWEIKLKETGEIESAAFKADETDVADKAMETCMVDVTKSIAFPASPSGKVTTYHHPFRFKPKN